MGCLLGQSQMSSLSCSPPPAFCHRETFQESALEGTLLRLSPLSGTFERLSLMRAMLKAQGDGKSPYRRLFFSKAFFPLRKKPVPSHLSVHFPWPRLPSPALLFFGPMVSLDLVCILLRLLSGGASFFSCSSRSGFPPGRPVSGSSPLAKSVPQRVLPYFT